MFSPKRGGTREVYETTPGKEDSLMRLLVTAGPLRSFQQRNYRFLWASDTLVRVAEHMELLVLAWFVLTETDSPFQVGLLGALRFTGTLLAPAYGVMVDRYDRRRLLVGGRVAFLVSATTILLLITTGRLEPWHVYLLAGFSGLARAFDNVTRQTILADVIARDELTNAMALTRTGLDTGQMVGPLIGGVLLSRADMGPTFVVIIGIYLSATISALLLRPSNTAQAKSATSMWRNLATAGEYISKNDAILALLLLALFINLAAFPLTHGLMPVFARDVLGTGPLGLAVLLWAASAGAFAGSLTLAIRKYVPRPGRIVVLAVSGWLAAFLLFSQSEWLIISIVILLVAGVAQSFTMVTMDTLLLKLPPNELRGRIMGVRSLAVYGLPMGLLLAGAMADVLGAPAALAISVVTGMALTMTVAVRLKGLWRLP